MSTHYKIDLYTNAQLEKLTTAIGDLLELGIPQPDGSALKSNCLVTDITKKPAGQDITTGEELTQVILTLENQ